jgi:pimeloyl-ACP methyl ester carboxylesterase
MWQRVARVLRATGNDVFAPSLTGIGERAHLASAAIDLSTHIADVLGTLECERLKEVVLVGHSYGGMVITGVAERAPERIGTLVYLDAFVPQSGQAMIDLLGAERRAALSTLSAPIAPLPPQAQGMTDPQEIAWCEARRHPQPFKTFTQPLALEGRYHGPRAYVFCSGYSPSSFAPFAERARNDPAWRFHELPTHHYPHVSLPRETAGVLLNYA